MGDDEAGKANAEQRERGGFWNSKTFCVYLAGINGIVKQRRSGVT